MYTLSTIVKIIEIAKTSKTHIPPISLFSPEVFIESSASFDSGKSHTNARGMMDMIL